MYNSDKIQVNFHFKYLFRYTVNTTIEDIIKSIDTNYDKFLTNVILLNYNNPSLSFQTKEEFERLTINFSDNKIHITSYIIGYEFDTISLDVYDLATTLQEKFIHKNLIGKIVRFKYNGGHGGIKIVRVEKTDGCYIKGNDLSIAESELATNYRQYDKRKIENFPNIEVLN